MGKGSNTKKRTKNRRNTSVKSDSDNEVNEEVKISATKPRKIVQTTDIVPSTYRLLAFGIDVFVLFVVLFLIGQSLNLWASDPNNFRWLLIVIPIVYFVLPTAIYGKTLGKWVFGIKVVDKEFYPPGIAAIGREIIGRVIVIITLGLGILWFTNDYFQGLNDKLAGTYVVRSKKPTGK